MAWQRNGRLVVAILLSSVAQCFSSAIKNEKDDVCGIWLAPSTIPGAGLGMFAGRNFSVGEELLTDLVVPISDIALHNHGVDYGPFLWDE